MANNNYVNIVNFTGGGTTVMLENQPIVITQDGAQSPGHKLPSGTNVTFTLNAVQKTFSLPAGENSWSTIVLTSLGTNFFPSGHNIG
ncbi:hypothetical protein N9L43_00495 [bacterium]|nr:hypothetical protein [bacterium]MDC0257286.1 hypothetical protein [Crocinitomicaceae bacterium]